MSIEKALAILREEHGVVYSEYEEAVDVIEKALAERPHGEWNIRHDTMYHFECPFCKYLHQYKDNFCPLCGADMRKEE